MLRPVSLVSIPIALAPSMTPVSSGTGIPPNGTFCLPLRFVKIHLWGAETLNAD